MQNQETRSGKFPGWLTDIRFWILLFFVLRMYGITDPPLENGHNWRQSLTNMIARNFLQEDNNILYPRIDYDGNKTGIIGSEFPVFNYLIYLMSLLAGYEHWYGRLINLLVSSFGIFYFFKLVRRFFPERTALYAALLLLSSIWLSFSRKSMPDTFCMSLVIIGIYHGMNYLYEGKGMRLMGFALFSMLGILCKIPALFLLSVMALPLFDREVPALRKRIILLAGMFLLVPVIGWYFYWVPGLLAEYGFQLYFPKSFSEGLAELIAHGPETMERFYFSATMSFAGTAAFMAGLALIILKKDRRMIWMFLLSTLFFLLFIVKTGAVFSLHNYYIVPYVPVMVLIAAHALAQIRNVKWAVSLVVLIMLEGFINQQHDPRIRETEQSKLRMESIADAFSGREDLFLTNGGQGPQQMYFLNRRGWTADGKEITEAYAEQRKAEGCRFVFINKHEEGAPVLQRYRVIYEDSDFVVYSL